MTETKFTPGPWEGFANGTVKGPEGNTVADVRYKNGKADKHLIAAAPDLYDALDRLLRNVDEGDFISTTRMSEARAALAKARGET